MLVVCVVRYITDVTNNTSSITHHAAYVGSKSVITRIIYSAHVSNFRNKLAIRILKPATKKALFSKNLPEKLIIKTVCMIAFDCDDRSFFIKLGRPYFL